MIYPVVRELAGDGIPVATACRVLEVSTSGFYEWERRPASDRAWDQAHLMHAIREAHAASYGTYGHRRIHAELVLGQHLAVSHGRVERLMRCAGLQGVHRRRLRGCTRVSPATWTICTRMPSHFHSATYCAISTMPSSSGCASMNGRNSGSSSVRGGAALSAAQANSGR